MQGARQARSDYSAALRLDPGNPAAYVNLAFNLQADGLFQLAWNLLTAGLGSCPRAALLYEARGVISLQMGNFRGAVMDLGTAHRVRSRQCGGR